MTRPVTAVGVLALALALVAPAAPPTEPADRPPYVPYFPTAVGTTWVHTDGTLEMHRTITKVVEYEGVTFVTVRDVTSPTRQWVSEVVGVSEKGLVQVQVLNHRLDPQFWMLKLPCAEGDRWQMGGDARGKMTMTAHPSEQVEVPAGRYTAIRVDYAAVTFQGKAKPQNWSWWFAPGVGMVKGRTTRTDGTTANWVLKSFTPGK